MNETRDPELIMPEASGESTALERITRGEVDMQVATAHRFPRSIKAFKEEALSMATLDQETAASCFYCVPRDGKTIEGPGVRLAEIVASCWRNLRAEARVVDEDGKFVTSQGTAWDIERNVLVRMEVKRRITNKKGQRYSDDMIVTTGNAASAIAFRNAVFKVVPSAYTKAIYEEVRKVAAGDAKTLTVRRDAAFAWFAKSGVAKDRVLGVLGKKGMDDVGLDDLVTLTGLRTAIAEGTTSVEEAFPTEDTAPTKPPEGKAKIGGSAKQQKTAEQVIDEAGQAADSAKTWVPVNNTEVPGDA